MIQKSENEWDPVSEAKQLKINTQDTIESFENVTRVEVIDTFGRGYANYTSENVKISFQDNGGTLKIFID
jgi:hypothetical protein